MHPALYYTRTIENKVRCHLCPHACLIADNETGTCNVRRNDKGILRSENYGQISGLAVDPIEKKPLYHFFPGMGILSIGSFGCNMACSFCQNAHISQASAGSSYSLQQYGVEEIIDKAGSMNQSMIAYTYNEPVVFYEFMLDCARLARSKSMKNVMVSNGFISKEPLEEIIEYIDAFNIDLKSFDQDFYKNQANARLAPVLESIGRIADSGLHLELTFLVIPGLNDDAAKFKDMIRWIEDVCGEEQVLHLSRYFPHYKLMKSSTPLSTIKDLTEIARSKLKYVYPGNTGLSLDSSTYCHTCNALLIERSMYEVKNTMDGSKCPHCASEVPGVFK
jgi:pyruvate formate lyase activating enzyme